jgi:predicted nucleic acid binding AN1-type Zn finger protein
MKIDFKKNISMYINMDKKKKRCSLQGCKKKLKITCFKCRCGLKFCDNHRLPEMHMCVFDFKENREKDLISKGLGGGEFKKVIKI